VTIDLLTVQRLRILKSAHLQPSPRVNLIIGPNAAGKTSLLEAIDVLSRGRSFRSHLVESLLTNRETSFTISARLLRPEGLKINVGVERSRIASRLRIDGENATSIADLAALLPVQVLHPESHQLIQGGPAHRRAYLDWGVFHVEPGFIQAWRHYRRALSQRNAALRSSPAGARHWDLELSEEAQTIDAHRSAYMQELAPTLKTCFEKLLGACEIEVAYRRGWTAEIDLAVVLERELAVDAQRGYTGSGPHRAEVDVRVHGRQASTVVSRGQQKLLSAALTLAQTQLFVHQTGLPCVVLVDDLPAELQVENRERLLAELAATNAQVFMTSTEANLINLDYWSDQKTFHVEQGHIRELI
jgi:DNA replication and repair protein RecF